MTPEQLKARVPIGSPCPECGAEVLTIYGDERGTWTDCGHIVTRRARDEDRPETGNPPGRRPELGGGDRKSFGDAARDRMVQTLVAGVRPSVVLDALLDEVEAARMLLPMSLQQPAAREAAQALGLARDALRDARTYAEVGEHL